MTEAVDLATLQRWMSHVVRHPKVAETAVKSGAARTLIRARRVLAGDVVLPNERMQPTDRLDVYGGAYIARLVGVIRSDFPGLEHALGEDAFCGLAEAYVQAYPSRHPNLNQLAHALPDFISKRTHQPRRAFLRDLARLELAMSEAFHAPQAAALDPGSLGAVTPEEWEHLVIPTHPSLRLLATSYPVNGYLQAVFDEREPDLPKRANSYVAVYRKDYRVWRLTLEKPAFATLSALANGEPFARALQHAGDSADQVGHWFQGWTADGLFIQP